MADSMPVLGRRERFRPWMNWSSGTAKAYSFANRDIPERLDQCAQSVRRRFFTTFVCQNDGHAAVPVPVRNLVIYRQYGSLLRCRQPLLLLNNSCFIVPAFILSGMCLNVRAIWYCLRFIVRCKWYVPIGNLIPFCFCKNSGFIFPLSVPLLLRGGWWIRNSEVNKRNIIKNNKNIKLTVKSGWNRHFVKCNKMILFYQKIGYKRGIMIEK